MIEMMRYWQKDRDTSRKKERLLERPKDLYKGKKNIRNAQRME